MLKLDKKILISTAERGFMAHYKTNKPREVFTVEPLTEHCGFEQCAGDFGPRARGKAGLASGAIFSFSFSRPFF